MQWSSKHFSGSMPLSCYISRLVDWNPFICVASLLLLGRLVYSICPCLLLIADQIPASVLVGVVWRLLAGSRRFCWLNLHICIRRKLRVKADLFPKSLAQKSQTEDSRVHLPEKKTYLSSKNTKEMVGLIGWSADPSQLAVWAVLGSPVTPAATVAPLPRSSTKRSWWWAQLWGDGGFGKCLYTPSKHSYIYICVCTVHTFWLFIQTYLYLSIHPSIHLSICVCLSVGRSVCLSVCLSVSLSICLSIYLSIDLSIYWSIDISIYPWIYA